MAKGAKSDLDIVMERDPAPKSRSEALLFSAGLHAIRLYRLSNRLYHRKHFMTARAFNYLARVLTGSDIHPGATIGEGFFIDHATGVVIGETSEIGNNVSIYQGVTLGGVRADKKKRHPTIGNNVSIGAGATILGPVTIGDNVRVGAGSVVVKSVPPNCTVVGIPAKIVKREGTTSIDLHHDELPDPVVNAFVDMCHSLSEMEYRLEMIEKKLGMETAKKMASAKTEARAEELSCPVEQKD
ncbi:MAG: serine O-acetyltransferase [Candidatus Thermoplasmatota archaeon]|nr:serine O-acetyltransferase [Candidatus Thermoplasmatota archaeon]